MGWFAHGASTELTLGWSKNATPEHAFVAKLTGRWARSDSGALNALQPFLKVLQAAPMSSAENRQHGNKHQAVPVYLPLNFLR